MYDPFISFPQTRPIVEDLIGETGFPKCFRVLVRVDANGPKFTDLSKCPMNET